MSRHRRACDDTEQGFVKRWSRRKTRSEDAGPPDPPPAEDSSEPVRASADGALEPDQQRPEDVPVKTDADMPDLDVIDEATDMSGFFSPGVSESLRTQALRRLFRLPKFNITDGLDDYNEDYRSFETLAAATVASDMPQRLETELESAGRTGETGPTPHRDPDARDRPGELAEEQVEEPSADQSQAESPGGPGTEDGDDPDAGEATPPGTRT